MLAFALAGCVRVHAAMALGSDDLVSGTIEIATVQTKPEDTGPPLTVSAELTDKVTLTPYAADGYIGQTVHFENLNFDQVRTLSQNLSSQSAKYQLNFRRSGDIVSLAGSINLTQLRPEGVDVQLKIAFPAQVGKTNGRVEQDNSVAWDAKAGQVTEFSATVQYSDQSGMSWTRWVLIVGAGAVGTALLVLVLALVAHRRNVRQIRQSEYNQSQLV